MIQIDPILPILHQYEYFSFLLTLSRNQHLYIALFCSILFMNRNMLVPSLYVSPYKLDQSLDLLSKNTVVCIFSIPLMILIERRRSSGTPLHPPSRIK